MHFSDTKAIYLQIADLICEQVLAKELHTGERLPSVREMAVNLGVNPNTVIRAYGFLENNSLIEMQRGIGYFVTTKAYHSALRLKREEFLALDVPKLFKMMDLLNLQFTDLEKLHQRRKSYENK